MVNSVHAPSGSDDRAGFRHYWLAEAIRLRESQWGPLQDDSEVRRARTKGSDFAQRLLLRASYLGQREGMDASIRLWTRGARLALLILLTLACLTGAAAALGALGDGSRQVNLVLALIALLGLHSLTFLFWLASSLRPTGQARTALGDVWLWLTKKLARGPQAALIPQALAGMLARQKALRPVLGAITHALWSVALAAMLIVLLALLSARRYTFNWETTLLSPDAFVAFTRTLGWLPSKVGFSVPPDTIIRASDGLQQLPDSAHALWSSWLIGCLVCYGLLPRILALAMTVFQAALRIRGTHLDIKLPGYIELRDRLDPVSVPGGIDAPAPPDPAARVTHPATMNLSTDYAVVGLELPADVPWPPEGLNVSISDLGVIDDRPERHQLLDTLQARAPQKLLIVCDGRQTPDRGLMALASELANLSAHTGVAVLNPPEQADQALAGMASDRAHAWKQQLQKAGLSPEDIYFNMASGVAWLTESATRPSPDRMS